MLSLCAKKGHDIYQLNLLLLIRKAHVLFFQQLIFFFKKFKYTDLAAEMAHAGQGVECRVVLLLAAVARAAAHVLGALAVLLALVKLEK